MNNLNKTIFNEVRTGSTFSKQGTVYRKVGSMTAHALYSKKEHVFYPLETVMIRK